MDKTEAESVEWTIPEFATETEPTYSDGAGLPTTETKSIGISQPCSFDKFNLICQKRQNSKAERLPKSSDSALSMPARIRRELTA